MPSTAVQLSQLLLDELRAFEASPPEYVRLIVTKYAYAKATRRRLAGCCGAPDDAGKEWIRELAFPSCGVGA